MTSNTVNQEKNLSTEIKRKNTRGPAVFAPDASVSVNETWFVLLIGKHRRNNNKTEHIANVCTTLDEGNSRKNWWQKIKVFSRNHFITP